MNFGNNKSKVVGFTDTPAEKDLLGIEEYYEALAAYIEKCQAPTTISIKGDWGTGKTTAIKSIKSILDQKNGIRCVCLNVWPYSSFEHGGNVSAALLQDFCSLLVESGIKKENLKNAVNITKKFMGYAASMGISLATHADVSVSGLFGNSDGASDVDSINDMKKFKAEIIKAVNTSWGFDRLVVFVDDLDRLNPRIALEILEGLKNFIDCEECIFVLAIDFDIVSQGVRLKYGENFQADKAKKFFDKIIQLQFHLPVGAYDIKSYLREEFLTDEDDVDEYVKVVRALVGVNPRNIKRAFNLLQLHELILKDEVTVFQNNKLNIFIILLIQLHSKELYFGLVKRRKSTEEIYSYIKNADEKDVDYLKNVDELLDLGIFYEYTGTSKPYNEDNMETFRSNIEITSKITSENNSDDADSSEVKIGKFVRDNLNRLIAEDKIDDKMIENFQDSDWCDETFNLKFAFLRKHMEGATKKEQIQVNGNNRYWTRPVNIRGNDYYVCSQWYDKNRSYFEIWLNSINQGR